jgi:hypothetical protein
MHEVAGKVSLQSRGAAPLMSGWVDLKPSVRGSNNRPDQRDGKRIVIEADWLSVTIDSNLGSAAATPNSLVLVLGRPVLDGRPVSAPELAPLFDGSSGVSDRLGGRFALVYCDLRSRAIELTTDRFGVWPLCWGQESTRLAFSDRADSVPTISASGPASALQLRVLPHDSRTSHGVQPHQASGAGDVYALRWRQG